MDVTLTVDTDKLDVDAFLELIELQEELESNFSARALRRMVELLKPAVTSHELGKLPHSQLRPAIQQIMVALGAEADTKN